MPAVVTTDQPETLLLYLLQVSHVNWFGEQRLFDYFLSDYFGLGGRLTCRRGRVPWYLSRANSLIALMARFNVVRA